ncbi:MAG: ABC transporter permease [Dehalococcoidia bacterium]
MKILAVASNTFREAIRDRVLYALLLFALLMIGGSVLLPTLGVGGESRIIKNFGLAATSVVGLVISIFIGVGLVYKEVDKRTAYALLAKPISRAQFVLGKYLGLAATLAVNAAVMGLGVVVIAYAWDGFFSPLLLLGVVFIFLELTLVTAVAILFSSFSTPTLSTLFTVATFVIGHLSQDLLLFAKQFDGPMMQRVMQAVYYLVPNLDNLNLKGAVVSGELPGAAVLMARGGYALAYMVALLALTILVFGRRDFR